MTAPRASFVIPVRNGQKYLHEALASCRAQSVKEIEIIVVNDGSTDGTQELVDWFSADDKRIRSVQLKENVGRSAARNRGNAEANSPIIFVLDADDRACKNRVRDTLIAFQMKNPDVVYGPYFQMDELGNVNGKVPAGPFNKELSVKRGANFIGHSTMAYRTGVTKNIQYDETGEYSRLGLDDWKFQWDCFLKGYKFGICKTFLSYWRNSGDGISNTRSRDEVAKLKGAFLAKI
jgi:teichuronic acid biosynthesis glycosyltransferase TuaG